MANAMKIEATYANLAANVRLYEGLRFIGDLDLKLKGHCANPFKRKLKSSMILGLNGEENRGEIVNLGDFLQLPLNGGDLNERDINIDLDYMRKTLILEYQNNPVLQNSLRGGKSIPDAMLTYTRLKSSTFKSDLGDDLNSLVPGSHYFPRFLIKSAVATTIVFALIYVPQVIFKGDMGISLGAVVAGIESGLIIGFFKNQAKKTIGGLISIGDPYIGSPYLPIYDKENWLKQGQDIEDLIDKYDLRCLPSYLSRLPLKWGQVEPHLDETSVEPNLEGRLVEDIITITNPKMRKSFASLRSWPRCTSPSNFSTIVSKPQT